MSQKIYATGLSRSTSLRKQGMIPDRHQLSLIPTIIA
jgi:hypothetical protein